MTAQIHEDLFYEGFETSMACCPALPKNCNRIIELTDEQLENPEYETNFFLFTTACWREYLGTWEIKNGRFFLISLEGRFRLTGDEPLFADWFSGTIRIPNGECIYFGDLGFDSIYENDIFVDIKNGVVVKERIVKNSK